MAVPVLETWASPEGELHASAPGDAIADGWIGLLPGSPPRIRLREGAVPDKAVAAMREAVRDLPPDMPVACGWGDGPLADVLAHLHRCAWPMHLQEPRAAYGKAVVRLARAHVEAPVAEWLAAGLAAGREPDSDRFYAARREMLAAAGQGAEAVRRSPAALGPQSTLSPEDLRALALARIAEIEPIQDRLERSWLGLAGAVAAAEGEPGKPVPLPAWDEDELVGLRRASERLHALEASGLRRLWSAFPGETRMGPALAVARSRLALGAHTLATARAKVWDGADPRATVAYHVQHECARHFANVRGIVADVEAAWRSLRTLRAQGASAGAPTP